MYLCQDAKTKEYYHLSNYENYSDSCLVFYMGTLENTKVLYKKINEYIISGDSTLNTTITDAKNRKFKLLAPQEENYEQNYKYSHNVTLRKFYVWAKRKCTFLIIGRD